MYGVRAHEFYCTPLLCKIIGSTTNSAKCGKTPVNGAKSPGMAWNPRGMAWNPREMQLNSGNSRAYFASIAYNWPKLKKCMTVGQGLLKSKVTLGLSYSRVNRRNVNVGQSQTFINHHNHVWYHDWSSGQLEPFSIIIKYQWEDRIFDVVRRNIYLTPNVTGIY